MSQQALFRLVYLCVSVRVCWSKRVSYQSVHFCCVLAVQWSCGPLRRRTGTTDRKGRHVKRKSTLTRQILPMWVYIVAVTDAEIQYFFLKMLNFKDVMFWLEKCSYVRDVKPQPDVGYYETIC